jgi:YhcH/YjgK/YiaL family protein
MILDTLSNARLYAACHPLFAQAFEALRAAGDGSSLTSKTPLGDSGAYYFSLFKPGKEKDSTPVESHRKYIDIQYTTAGIDVIGWLPLSPAVAGRGYNPGKDIEFYDQRPQSWFDVPAGSFAVFFPNDGHAPMGTPNHIGKIVVKIPVLD